MDDEYLLIPEPGSRDLPTGVTPERFHKLALTRWPDSQHSAPVAPLAATVWFTSDDSDVVIDLHPDGTSLTITSAADGLIEEVAIWWAGLHRSVAFWLYDASMAGYSTVAADSASDPLL